MPEFIINCDSTHEVHDLSKDCSFLPSPENIELLGWHDNCELAVLEAQKMYPHANGCYYCANDCHIR